jgi:hypothetical protein
MTVVRYPHSGTHLCNLGWTGGQPVPASVWGRRQGAATLHELLPPLKLRRHPGDQCPSGPAGCAESEPNEAFAAEHEHMSGAETLRASDNRTRPGWRQPPLVSVGATAPVRRRQAPERRCLYSGSSITGLIVVVAPLTWVTPGTADSAARRRSSEVLRVAPSGNREQFQTRLPEGRR